MEYLRYTRTLRLWLSVPFIYGVIVPLVFLDIILEIYHRICFPLYGLQTLRRRKYIVIDRHRLPYLNVSQKIHCVYCGYANGLMAYASEIIARTERFWCGIKHKARAGQHVPTHHKQFVAYGDETAFRERYEDR